MRDYKYIHYKHTLFQKKKTDVYKLTNSRNKIIKYYYYLDKRT